MEFHLEKSKECFKEFWNWIRAEGDWASALKEWEVTYNASKT